MGLRFVNLCLTNETDLLISFCDLLQKVSSRFSPCCHLVAQDESADDAEMTGPGPLIMGSFDSLLTSK